ncbi:MAG: patatin-like phospholipase family protein [Deltaproteobacteria bacterium]|nr:MAG: patatin-like phospholipase family protein [Deltaproteobacteria bacterium]
MSSAVVPGSYDAVVFAGGGCRCFWQAGFWSEAGPALAPAPRLVGAVSAGAAFACAIFAGRVERVVDDFGRRVASNPRNAYLANALRREPVFPHERLYRSTILANLDDDALARLHAGPDIRISVGRAPAWSGDRAGYLLGVLAFLLEQRTRDRVHAAWGRRLGFGSDVISVRDCSSPAELAELILHSSCTPPLTPLYRRGSRAVLDGGVYDHVPVETVAHARSALVLLTRRHPEAWLPRVEGRTYVQPSEPVPVAKWDYTNAELVRRTFDLGRFDGERFARRLLRSDAA